MNQIKDILNTLTKYTIISALAALGMGIVLIFASEAVFRTVCVIFGLLLLIPAVCWIYEGVVKGGGAKLIVPGVLAALAGAFVTFRSADVAAVIGVFFGIFLLIAGLVHVSRALLRKRAGDAGWLLSCILGAGVCAFGVICIIKNGAVTTTLMRIYGVAFLIYAAAAMLSAFEFNKTAALTEGVEAQGETVEPDEADPAQDETIEVDGRVIEVIDDTDETPEQ